MHDLKVAMRAVPDGSFVMHAICIIGYRMSWHADSHVLRVVGRSCRVEVMERFAGSDLVSTTSHWTMRRYGKVLSASVSRRDWDKRRIGSRVPLHLDCWWSAVAEDCHMQVVTPP